MQNLLTNDIILRVRSRLRDTNYLAKDGVRFSDSEIIDALNDTAHTIVKSLKINISQAAQILSKGKQTLRLSQTPCAIIKATYNGAPLPIKPHSQIIQTPLSPLTLYPISPKEYALSPSKSDGIIEIWASFCPRVKSANDEIALDSSFAQLLTYGILERLFQIETNENNLQRVKFYEAQYQKELRNIKDLLNKTSEDNESYKTQVRFF